MMGLSRFVLACVLAVPIVAAAQPKASDKQQAQELVKRAIAKSQANDHLGAIDLYLDAYRLVPLAQLLSNIGTEYQSAQKPVEALKYFCKYLDAEPTGSLSTYANAQAKVLQIQLGNRDVDDKNVCKPPKPDTKTDPDADAATDKPVGRPKARPADPKPSLDETKEGTVSSTSGSTMKYVGLGGVVLGAAVFGVGGYYGLRAKKFSDEITNHDPAQPWPDSIKQDEADGKTAQTRQIAFMIAGGAIVATGVVVYLVGRSKTPEEQHGTVSRRHGPRPQVVVVPAASPDSVGLVVSGGF
jgi:tetratricopeptide (TPR) repeat protein